MSQFYVNSSAAPLPPTVPTSFTTDVRDNTTNSPGNATPSANVIQILGRDTSQNNDNGIRTDADPNNGNIVYVELTNRVTGAVTTTDATTTTIISLNLGSNPGVFIAQGDLTAYNLTDIAGASYTFEGAMRTTGAAAVEIGVEGKNVFEEVAMAAADFTISASGNNLIVQVTGIAGKTIDWNAFFTYRFVG